MKKVIIAAALVAACCAEAYQTILTISDGGEINSPGVCEMVYAEAYSSDADANVKIEKISLGAPIVKETTNYVVSVTNWMETVEVPMTNYVAAVTNYIPAVTNVYYIPTSTVATVEGRRIETNWFIKHTDVIPATNIIIEASTKIWTNDVVVAHSDSVTNTVTQRAIVGYQVATNEIGAVSCTNGVGSQAFTGKWLGGEKMILGGDKTGTTVKIYFKR